MNLHLFLSKLHKFVSLIEVYILDHFVSCFSPLDPVHELDIDPIKVETAIEMPDAPHFDGQQLD